MSNFWMGFEKQAADAAAAVGLGSKIKGGAKKLWAAAKQHKEEIGMGAGLAGATGGLGVLSGHAAHVGKKLQAARAGKEYKPESFTERHPKAMGAATFGIAPSVSLIRSQRKLDRDNPRVRKVMTEHPFMTSGM